MTHEEIGRILLENAKKYDGELEEKPTPELLALLNRTGRTWTVDGPAGGHDGMFNILKDGWCSDFVAGNNDECGFGKHVGRAEGWKNFGVEVVDEKDWQIPGVIVVFPSHVAYRDDKEFHIFGGNQSNKVCSQHEKYYGVPIAYVLPESVPVLMTTEASEEVDVSEDEFLNELKKISSELKNINASLDHFKKEDTAVAKMVIEQLQKQHGTLTTVKELIEDHLSKLNKRTFSSLRKS